MKAEIDEVMRVRGPLSTEYRLIRPDGSVVWVRDESVTVFDEAGSPQYAHGFLLDVTDRKDVEERYRILSDSLPLLTYIGRLEGHRPSVFISPQIEAFGWTREEWLADPAIFMKAVHPDDRERVRAAFERANDPPRRVSLEYRLLTRDGRTRWIHDESIPVGEGESAYVVGFGLDITVRRNAEARLEAQYAVARALADTSTLEGASPRILEAVCRSLDFEFGGLWRAREGALRLVELWASPNARLPGFVEATRTRTFDRGEGLPGRVWHSGEPAWVPLIEHDKNLPRAPVAVKEGLRSALAFPIRIRDEVHGVIEFFSRHMDEPDEALIQMLSAAAGQVGQFLERIEAEELVREREASLAEAQRIAHIGSWSWDISEDRVTWSDELLRIYGIAEDEFAGTYEAFLERLHPDDRERADAIVRRAFETGESFAYDHRIGRPDGEIRTLHAEGEVVVGEDGRPTRMAGVAHDITEQVAAELELLRAHERYRSLVERIPLVTYVDKRDEHSTSVYASPQIEQLLGYSPEEWTSDQELFRRILHPDDIDRIPRYVTYEAGDTAQLEYRVIARDGRVVWLRDEFVVVEGEDGELRLEGFLLDITGRKHAEEQLRESEERFRAMFESAAVGIVLIDPERRILVTNQTFERMLGYTKDELSGMSFTRLTHPDDEPRSREILPKLSEGAETDTLEKRYIHKNGEPVWARVTAAPVRAEMGELQYAIGIIEDVTERKQAEERLRESEARYTTLVETARDAFVSIDEESRIMDWNRQAEHLFGWPKKDALGRVMPELIMPPQFRDAHRVGLRRFLETGAERVMDRTLEFTALHRSGREFPVELRIWPTREGESWRFHALVRDVSERKELEDQLRQAQKMEAVGRLAGGVAHDFNNLLLAIRGYSELTAAELETVENAQAARTSLEEIAKATERAGSLTRQLLAFGRKQVLTPRVLDVSTLVRDDESLFRRLLGEDVELRLALDPKPCSIRVDPVQLEQVIMNIAINAREAMPKGGTVTITTSRRKLARRQVHQDVVLEPGRYVTLEIADTGIGMDEDTQSQVFEPFFTTKPGGSGLGLATAYGIVAQSGGRIEVESELWSGSAFRILLPGASRSTGDRDRAPRATVSVGGAETVLVVEDEEAVREVVATMLERLGYTVLRAASADEGLELFAGNASEVDLLLTDVVMPGRSGKELADEITARRPSVAVLFMSGYAAPRIGDIEAAERAGMLLRKPFGTEELARKVRSALATRRSRIAVS